MNRRCVLLLCVVSFTTLCCAGVADDEKVSDNKSVAEVKLTAGTWQDVEKLVVKNAGKVVVIDVWSTSCGPCMEEFPHLLELQKKYLKQIVCVSLNVDYVGIKSKPPEYYRPRVEKFLNAKESTILNFLCTTESDEFFDERKLNSIPAVYVYGTDGKLAKRFDDSLIKPGAEESFSYEHQINPFVAELLAK